MGVWSLSRVLFERVLFRYGFKDFVHNFIWVVVRNNLLARVLFNSDMFGDGLILNGCCW